MAIADPKTYTKAKDDESPDVQATMATVLAEALSLIKSLKDSGGGASEAAQKQADVLERLLIKTRPENPDHPGISAFSYPEGDQKRPKPELKCKYIWCGFEEKPEQLTPLEIELRNQLEPGHYFVTKANGMRIKFDVAAKYTDGGRLEEMSVWFPCKNEHRTDHMPNTSYLRQALGEHIPSTDELLVEIARLKAQLAAPSVLSAV